MIEQCKQNFKKLDNFTMYKDKMDIKFNIYRWIILILCQNLDIQLETSIQ